MRTIRFRALKDDVSNCRFYYGSLIYDKEGNPRIYDLDTDLFHTCIKGTEGQYIDFKDMNGKDIYEGHNVEYESSINCEKFKGVIEHWARQSGNGFRYRSGRFTKNITLSMTLRMKIIENS